MLKPHIRTEEQRQRNADAARRSKFKRKYGLTPERFDIAAAAQDGICPLCMMQPPSLTVDMANGSVRGLICRTCLQDVKEWDGRDVVLIESTTSDPLILRMVSYLRHPPGLKG